MIFAGPASGNETNIPTFRSLVANDLPTHTHNANNISNFTNAVINVINDRAPDALS